MSDFKLRHFEGVVILWAVRWYCKYGISYRNVEEMLDERGSCQTKLPTGDGGCERGEWSSQSIRSGVSIRRPR